MESKNVGTKTENYRPTIEYIDVAVIGSGFAGLSAAIEARNTGARVKVFEKAGKPGGNSALSGGGIAAASTERQLQAGIKDSVEQMSQDMITAGLGLNYPELVHELAVHSNEAFKWLEDYVGVKFRDRIDIFGGHSVLRCFTPEGWGQRSWQRCWLRRRS
jgi:succinate dehydrogenase/fumarate reductase flavoprotein subunit